MLKPAPERAKPRPESSQGRLGQAVNTSARVRSVRASKAVLSARTDLPGFEASAMEVPHGC